MSFNPPLVKTHNGKPVLSICRATYKDGSQQLFDITGTGLHSSIREHPDAVRIELWERLSVMEKKMGWVSV